jgi:predicted HTH transcriptional regulator
LRNYYDSYKNGRTIPAKDLVKEFEKTYGSIEQLEKVLEKGERDIKMAGDLDDWKYFLENPDEEIKDRKTIFRDHTTISTLELELMNFIKYDNPKSVSELAKLIHKDISTIQRKINNLEKEVLIKLEEGNKNNKIPVLNYDKIEIAI